MREALGTGHWALVWEPAVVSGEIYHLWKSTYVCLTRRHLIQANF